MVVTGEGHAWWRPALVMFSVGYGANQFVPLLAVYRHVLRLSDTQATAIFGVYALGLIPGLLLAGPASDRHGRRPLMIGFAWLSLLATAVLITGRWGSEGLYAGRLLTGVVSGGAFSVGTAWVKELSGTSAGRGAGAKRGALALTAGFGVGPLVAGVLAQSAPQPELLPYLLHLLIALGAALLLLPAPETVSADARRPRPLGWRVSSAHAPRFTRVVMPLGPWVFGSVTLIFTTLPAHASGPLQGLGVLFSGGLAAAGLAAGLAVQPLARRLQDRSLVRGTADAAAAGLAVVTVGCLVAAAAASRPGVAQATAAALLLGAGYGFCILAGLREVEQLAPDAELGSLVAIFYALAYSGLAIPYLLALVAPRIGYPAALLLTAAVAALTLVWVAVQGRRGSPGCAPA